MATGAVTSSAPATSTNGSTNGTGPVNGTGVAATQLPEAGQTSASQPPKQEAYRFKKTLKVSGKPVAVDLDEAGIERELQTGRHYARQWEEAQSKLRAAAELEQLLASNPREALKRKGLDFDQLLLTEAQRAAQMAEMTPEQQRIAELEHQLAQRDEFEKQQKQQQEQALAERRRANTQNQVRKEVFESLKHVGFPIDGEGNRAFRGAALAMGAKIQARAIRAGQPRLTPQQLGEAVQRQFLEDSGRVASVVAQVPEFRTKNAGAISSLLDGVTAGLEGQALLDMLGPKMQQRLIQAQMAALQKRAGVTVGGQQSQTQQPGKDEKPVLDYYTLQKAGQRY